MGKRIVGSTMSDWVHTILVRNTYLVFLTK